MELLFDFLVGFLTPFFALGVGLLLLIAPVLFILLYALRKMTPTIKEVMQSRLNRIKEIPITIHASPTTEYVQREPSTQSDDSEHLEFVRGKHLFTNSEYALYCGLQTLMGEFTEPMQIWPKVRLVDLVECDRNTRRKYLNYHVDYVIASNRGNVLGCIELDDNSHDNGSGRARDGFKDEILQKARIPLLRIRLPYDVGEIKKFIQQQLSPK